MSASQSSAVANDSKLAVSQTAVGLDPAASMASLIPILIIVAIVIIGAVVILPMIQK
jgi:hypothetical protein